MPPARSQPYAFFTLVLGRNSTYYFMSLWRGLSYTVRVKLLNQWKTSSGYGRGKNHAAALWVGSPVRGGGQLGALCCKPPSPLEKGDGATEDRAVICEHRFVTLGRQGGGG